MSEAKREEYMWHAKERAALELFMQQQQTAAASTEPHYTAEQVAEFWSLDANSVRRVFRDEPGVLKFGNDKSTYQKRAYTTIRIPQSVLDRVYRRMTNRAA